MPAAAAGARPGPARARGARRPDGLPVGARTPGRVGAGSPRKMLIASDIRFVRQSVAIPRSAYASARTGSLILAIDLPDAERLVGQLGGHHVAVVALGHRDEDVGALGAGPAEDVLVGAVAADGVAAERRRQAVERLGREVEDDHVVAGGIEVCGEDGADPAAADDDDLHDGSPGIGSRTTQTAHGAFLST